MGVHGSRDDSDGRSLERIEQALLAEDPAPRLRRLHALVDEMLEHPRARARRTGGS